VIGMAGICEFLHDIPILPRRLLLATPGVEASVPMLRGTWGAALHDNEPEAYRAVFGEGEGESGCPSGYLFRPAPPDAKLAPAVDFFLVGPAVMHDDACRRAWQEAARRGLGKNRRPFTIRAAWLLGPAGTLREEPISVGNALRGVPPVGTPPRTFPTEASAATEIAWPLSRASWPLPPDAPCRLTFAAPLRLRRHGRLVEEPTLADIVVGACRRIEAFLPDASRPDWKDYAATALELARNTPRSAWAGSRLDLHRWSARQQNEVDLHGVSGTLDLPAGPGELAPLLAAARWLHLGKGTVMGLGQFEVG
jgi:hypothetical protein